MLAAVKNDFDLISEAIGGNFQYLATDELQTFSQNYDFHTPIINLYPIRDVSAEINAGFAVRWDVNLTVDFLQKAPLNATENEKDSIIDEMIDLSVLFIRRLHKNERRVFESPVINMSSNVFRFKTSQYCVGVSLGMGLRTACNRINL